MNKEKFHNLILKISLIVLMGVFGLPKYLDAANVVYINEATSTPIILDQPQTTYILNIDIVAPATAFVVAADDVTLDLNGHTVTYANEVVNVDARILPNWDIVYGNNAHYGVALPPNYLRKDFFPDVPDNAFKGPKRTVIKNGSITQGASNAGSSHGVYIYATFVEIYNVTITVYGVDTCNITADYPTNLHIHHNILYHNGTEVTNRHQGREVIGSINGGDNILIHDNKIYGGPQWGIRVSAPSTTKSLTNVKVYNNEIRHNTKVANGYAIGAYAPNMEVYNNTVIPISGRGIHIEKRNNVNVHDNYLDVKENPVREYSSSYWVHGIKLEGCTNSKVHHNTVIARALPQSDARALDITVGENSNNEIYENNITAIAGPDTKEARALFLDETGGNTGTIIRNNIFTSNSIHVSFFNANDFQLTSNTFRKGENPVNYYTLYFSNYPETATSINNTFLDSKLENGANFDSVYFNSTWGKYSSFYVKWYLDVLVKDEAGNLIEEASVNIKDKDGNDVFSGTTDTQGRIRAVLTEFYRDFSSKTSYSPYTVLASKGGYSTESTQVTLDSSKEISLVLTPQSPYIWLKKSADKDNVLPDEVLTYTIFYKNIGAFDAPSVVISDFIPQNTTYVINSTILNGTMVSPDPYDPNLKKIILKLGDIPKGGSGTISFKVKVD